MPDFSVLLTHKAAEAIRKGAVWGQVVLKVATTESIGAVVAISHGSGGRLPVDVDVPAHFLKSCDNKPWGYWYRVSAELHAHWLLARAQRAAVTVEGFRRLVGSGFQSPGGNAHLAITHVTDGQDKYSDLLLPEFALWRVSADGAEPLSIDVEPDVTGARALAPHWPVADLESARVLVVGCGSIGGAAARDLALAGVGRLDLVDPGRLRWRNLPRHICGPRHVGRLKVNALREDLTLLREHTEVRAHATDVVLEADRVRDLLQDTDIVLCAADGVVPRRVVSHLARRAGVPAILACVLENGQVGELIRLRPWQGHGCLQCRRDALFAKGGMRPEFMLAADYGTGSFHRPMTAVGSDLHLIGSFAAKVALATLLHDKGHHDQRIDAEHAVVALRPRPGWAPPYDVERAGDVRWMPGSPPRSGCPTCEPV